MKASLRYSLSKIIKSGTTWFCNLYSNSRKKCTIDCIILQIKIYKLHHAPFSIYFVKHTVPEAQVGFFNCPEYSDHAKNFVWPLGKFWDVSQLFLLGKSKDNIIFSALWAPRKSWGTYFYVKSKNNWGLLSSLFSILAIKMHFLPFFCYFLPPHHFSCKLGKNAF